MRAGALSDKSVGEYINQNFVSAWKRVGTFTAVQKNGKTVARAGGNVAIYFCTPDLEVIHAIAGPVGKKALLAGAKWAVETYRQAKADNEGDAEALTFAIKKAHKSESKKSSPYGQRLNNVGRASGCEEPAATPQVKSGCDSATEVSPPPALERVQELTEVVRESATFRGRSATANKARAAGCGEDAPAVKARSGCDTPPEVTVVSGVTTTSTCDPVQEDDAARTARLTRANAQALLACGVADVQDEAEVACVQTAAIGGQNLHAFLARKGLPDLDRVYRHVFEKVLGQRVTEDPVKVRELPARQRGALRSVPAAIEPRPDDGRIRALKSQLKEAMEQIEQLKKQMEELKAQLDGSK